MLAVHVDRSSPRPTLELAAVHCSRSMGFAYSHLPPLQQRQLHKREQQGEEPSNNPQHQQDVSQSQRWHGQPEDLSKQPQCQYSSPPSQQRRQQQLLQQTLEVETASEQHRELTPDSIQSAAVSNAAHQAHQSADLVTAEQGFRQAEIFPAVHVHFLRQVHADRQCPQLCVFARAITLD